MNILLVDRKGSVLHTHGGRVFCTAKNEPAQSFPLKLIDHVALVGSVNTDASSLRCLLTAGVGVSLLNTYQPANSEILWGAGAGNVQRRLAQYRACTNKHLALPVARLLVGLKIRNSLRWLRHWRHAHNRHRLILTKSTRQIEKRYRKWRENPTLPVTSLLGIEGTVARTFWRAFATLTPPAFGFNGRKKRPPPDPVNALLSLAFTLLHHRAVLVCAKTSLDPALGFLHSPAYYRQSLACDLVEPQRPAVSNWVLHAVRQGVFRPENFSRHSNGCQLNKNGRQRFFSQFIPFLRQQETQMLRHARALQRYLKHLPVAEDSP